MKNKPDFSNPAVSILSVSTALFIAQAGINALLLEGFLHIVPSLAGTLLSAILLAKSITFFNQLGSRLNNALNEKHPGGKSRGFGPLLTLLDSLLDRMQQEADSAQRCKLELGEKEVELEEMRQKMANPSADSRGRENRTMLNASDTLEHSLQVQKECVANLQESFEQTGSKMQEQKDYLSQVAGTMEEMSQSVAEVAENASTAAKQEDNAREKAEQGLGIVNQAEEAIQGIDQKKDKLGESLHNLGSSLQDIDRVMNVIDDIADQTNLLALNAAIEAARVGDAGNGFAVVADEVRKLAEKAMQSTREVKDTIQNIRSESDNSLQLMQETEQAVREGVYYSEQSGSTFQEIVDLIRDNSKQIQNMATITNQQASAVNDTARTTAEIDNISEHTLSLMQNVKQSMQDLDGQIREVSTLNQVFKLLGKGEVQKSIQDLSVDPEILSFEQSRQEKRMQHVLNSIPELELLYLTDSQGKQIVRNISGNGQTAAYGTNGLGIDWSDRPWFKEVVKHADLYVTKSYISSATGKPCITICSPVLDNRESRMEGVIAADVSLN